MKKGVQKKFFISKISLITTVILFIVSITTYISLYAIFDEPTRFVSIIKEILLVSSSIFGTNLLLSILIEKDEKNNLVDDIIVNDVFASSSFFDNMTEGNKDKLADALILHGIFEGNKDLLNMSQSVQKKLIQSKEGYYLERCAWRITIHDKGDYFEKDTIRTMWLVPYEDELIINHFRLATLLHSELGISGVDNYIWNSVFVNGVDTDINSEVKTETSAIADSVFSKNGYSESISFFLEKNIVLKKNKPVELTLDFTVRCPKSDIVSTYRTNVPCKEFSVQCNIVPEGKYKLLASAFGFWDHASGNMSKKHDSDIFVHFRDWIFKDDGVCIVLSEKK